MAPSESTPAADRRSTGAAPAAVAAGALLLVAVVVAISSGSGDLGDGPSIVVGQGLFGLMSGGLAVVIVVGCWLWWLRLRQPAERGPRRRRPSQPWWLRSLVVVVMLLAFMVAASWLLDARRHDDGAARRAATTTTRARAADDRSGSGAVDPGVPAAFFAGVAVAVLGASVLLRRAHRRLVELGLGGGDGPDADVDAALATALAASLTDLDAEPDPRRAVIAAYSRMQAVVASVGLPRRTSETELEFLGRALTFLGAAGEPARRLTDLFAQARYSDHDVDENMRAEAIAAVRRLKDDLGVRA